MIRLKETSQWLKRPECQAHSVTILLTIIADSAACQSQFNYFFSFKNNNKIIICHYLYYAEKNSHTIKETCRFLKFRWFNVIGFKETYTHAFFNMFLGLTARGQCMESGQLRHDASVATHFEKITHFENFFQSAFNLGPNQRILKDFFKVR